jgi:hypothetical protein
VGNSTKVPADLVEHFAKGNGALFVGAGLSKGAGLPDWAELISELGDELDDCPPSSDLRDLARYYEIEYGRNRLIERIRKHVDRLDVKPTQVHRALASCTVGVILTTNYDDLLEQALRAARRSYSVIIRNIDAGFWSAERLQLVKLHGDLAQPESVVITSRDYERYGLARRPIVRLIETILQTRTVLFLGYSVTDPDLRHILTQVQEETGGHARNLYSVQLDATSLAVRDLEARGVKVINLRPGSAAVNDLLGRWLEDLNREVRNQPRQGTENPAGPAEPTFGRRLADEVIGFLRAMGYSVSDLIEDLAFTEFVAQRPSDGTTIRRRFRCIEGSIGTGHVQAMIDSMVSAPRTEGWIVTYRSGMVTRQAREKAAAAPGVKILSLPDFYRVMLGLDSYLERMLEEYEETDVNRYWVDLAGQVPQFDGKRSIRVGSDGFDSVEEFLDAWLDTPGKNHISILGDFGTGKSWLCQHYAARLARKYLADCEHNRVPIVISLKDYPRVPNLRELITDTLVNRHGVDLPGGYETFEHLNRHDSLVLIFDGFDEMQAKTDDAISSKTFEELAGIVLPGANCKVILTCRGSYFRTDLEARGILGGGGSNRIKLRHRPNFEILELLQFDAEQMRLAVRLRDPAGAVQIYSRIEQTYDLPDLARRPILLAMIVDTIAALGRRRRVTPAALYQIYTDKWIEKNVAEERTFVAGESKRYFMQELAWAMFSRQTTTMAYVEFPEAVKEYFSLDDATDVDHFEHDIRTQSFLQRTPLGLYSFAHTSFMDFFIAQRIAAEIAAGDSSKLGSVQTSHETDQFIRDFAGESPRSVAVLTEWMRRGDTAILRVNSTGILAKLGDPTTSDDVAEVLAADYSVRRLYLTAVLSRVLDIEWDSASRLAEETGGVPRVVRLPADQIGRLAACFSREVANARDGGARWLSAFLLGHIRDVAPSKIDAAVRGALAVERSGAIGRAMRNVLDADDRYRRLEDT